MAAMALIETERATPNKPRQRDSALRDWVRALEGDRADRRQSAAAAAAASSRNWRKPTATRRRSSRRGESFTYRALAARANRYARWALDQGLAKGETVCLMMPNRPEYLAIWLGLTAVGVVVVADQHQVARRRARPLHRHRRAEARHRRRRIAAQNFAARSPNCVGQAENLGAWRRRRR